MGQFVYLKNYCPMRYPIGQYYSNINFSFLKETARVIHETFPLSNKLVLVVRGHSGSILAGGIAYLLKRKHREVLISVSRKAEVSHGNNLEGIYKGMHNTNIIVLDDYIESGDTIYRIIGDLYTKLNISHFDMLCVANKWDNTSLLYEKNEDTFRDIISHFDYICCNKPIR